MRWWALAACATCNSLVFSASRAVDYAGLYLVLKCPMVYERVGGLAASARAVLRRSAVYGALVQPGDPGLLESGSACSICQARRHASPMGRLTPCVLLPCFMGVNCSG